MELYYFEGLLPVTESDAAAVKVIGGDFKRDPIADKNSNPEFAHLASGRSKNYMPIFKLYAEIGVPEYLGNRTL